MENKENVLQLELKNLYALEKQSVETWSNLDTGLSHKKMKKLLKKWNKKNNKHFNTLQKLVNKNNINPGSTVDSVATEILQNIQEISSNDVLDDETKMAGLYASLNRFIHYKIACYTSTRRMSKAFGDSKTAKSLKSILKDLNKSSKRIDKYGKKYFIVN